MAPKAAIKNILVVDDNPGDIGLIRQVLEMVPNLVIHIAHSVMQAHAFLNKMPPYTISPIPDLIFLDLRMPLLPGFNVIPLVKRDSSLQKVKIVMFTSSSLSSDRIHCDALGADDYVVKPSDWNQWQSTVSQVLARHKIISHD